MSAIFISHSSSDGLIAREIHDWLTQVKHYDSIFLDSDPEQGIAAGREWERELYARLEICRALIVLCSPRSMTSRWCFHEAATAKARGIDIFPAKIEDCELDPILSDRQIVDLARNKAKGLERLWQGLLQAGLDPTRLFHYDPAKYQVRGPYPGFTAFDWDDAAIYFGRDEAIDNVRRVLNQRRQQGGPRLVLIVGASGSGKSSLMRAGVMPRLARDQQNWIVLRPLRPLGPAGPINRLAYVLGNALMEVGAQCDREEIALALTAAARADPVDGLAINRGSYRIPGW